jgi:hypothetical protein
MGEGQNVLASTGLFPFPELQFPEESFILSTFYNSAKPKKGSSSVDQLTGLSLSVPLLQTK